MKIAITLFTICATLCVNTQKKFDFKVETAEAIHWSGGIAGHSGDRYSTTISWKGSAPAFTIDSLWENDKAHAINFSYDKKEGKTRQTHVLKYEDRRTFNNTGLVEPIKVKPPIAYKGVALVRYITGGKKHYFVVKNYTKTDILNYP